MKVVTAASRPDGTAASRIHRARRPQPMARSGGGSGLRLGRAPGRGSAPRWPPAPPRARPAEDGDRRRGHEREHNRANPTAHAARWSPSPNRGPRGTGRRAGPGASHRSTGRTASTGRAPGLAPPAREPGRDERGRRREHEHRRPHRQGEDPQDVDRRRQARRLDVRGPERRDQEPGQRREGQPDVHGRPAPRSEPDGRGVTVQVAEQQDRLEEDEHGRPHGRRATECREHELADERLDPEQQERRPADGQREDGHRRDRGGWVPSVKWEDRVDPSRPGRWRPARAARPQQRHERHERGQRGEPERRQGDDDGHDEQRLPDPRLEPARRRSPAPAPRPPGRCTGSARTRTRRRARGRGGCRGSRPRHPARARRSRRG